MLVLRLAATWVVQLLVALLLAYPVDVGRVDLVPCSHVLLHASRHACLLAARESAAGLGNALVEAVLLEFLEDARSSASILALTGPLASG